MTAANPQPQRCAWCQAQDGRETRPFGASNARPMCEACFHGTKKNDREYRARLVRDGVVVPEAVYPVVADGVAADGSPFTSHRYADGTVDQVGGVPVNVVTRGAA